MRHLLLIVLGILTACPKPPPVVPEGSRTLPAATSQAKEDVYWRGDAKNPSSQTGPDWQKDVQTLSEKNPLKSFTQKQLKNGLRVYAVAHRELPLFASVLVIPSGSVNDGKNLSGLSALTADLLSMGANGKDAQAIATAVESLGAELSVSAGVERTFLATSGLARDADTLLGLLADITYRPDLNPSEFQRVQTLRTGLLLESLNDDSQVAADAIRGSYFGAHPYGLPPEGTPDTVKVITLEDVKTFHKSHFVPKNAFLVLVGDIDPEKSISFVEKHFRDWKGEAPLQSEVPAFQKTPMENEVIIVNKPDASQVQIRIAWKGIPAAHPDENAIDLVNTTLGGGFTAHLMDELRVNSGYTYGAYSNMIAYRSTGYFLLRTFTKKSSLRPAIDLALKVVSDYNAIKQNEVEFSGAKAYLAGQFPATIETTANLAFSLAESIFLGQGPKRIIEFVPSLQAIDPQKARETIDTYLPNQKSPYKMVLIGPADDIKPMVTGLGKVSIVPLGKHFGGGL